MNAISNRQVSIDEVSAGRASYCKRSHRTRHKITSLSSQHQEYYKTATLSLDNSYDKQDNYQMTVKTRLPLNEPIALEASQHSTVINARNSKIVQRDMIIKTTTTTSHRQRQSVYQSCDQEASTTTMRPMCHPRRKHLTKCHRRFSATKGCCSASILLTHHRNMAKSMFMMMMMMMMMLVTVTVTILVTCSASDISPSSSHSARAEALVSQQSSRLSGDNKQQQPQAEAIISSSSAPASNQNVIIIKYANVTKDYPSDSIDSDNGRSNSQQLNVYQLYNEPLSVSVIESKFSHSIQLFDVSQNQLPTLSKDLFCPLSNEVRQLNISHNLLENFDCLGLISQAGQLCLSELRILDMSFNLIRHLPATGVATLHNLEVLNLSHNLIESLDELSLSSLFKLTKLDLSSNRIQQLPMRIFHKSSSMKVLKLQSNYLQTNINQMLLSGLISLEEINLSFNNISHVSESAFLEKPNLTRVDLSRNQLTRLRQESLRVTISPNKMSMLGSTAQQQQQQQPIYKPRLHHNGNYAGLSQVVYPPTTTSSNSRQQQQQQQITNIEFYFSSNPFICDCHLEWMRKFYQQQQQAGTIRRSVLSSSNGRFTSSGHYHDPSDSMMMQSDQPVASTVIQTSSTSSETSSSPSSNNLISENGQQSPGGQQHSASSNQATISTSNNNDQQQQYGRIADLEHIKCTPLFKRNAQLQQMRHNRTVAHSSGEHHNNNNNNAGQQHHSLQVHHPNNHLIHPASQHHHTPSASASQMVDLLSADSSNFLCGYKSHCFALCHCCEFDACDCEMICPHGCNCYYDSSWQTNIIDCSANNHKVVPDRIPMDVSGLYLDGNNIDSLRPSNLIARKSLKTLFLNSSNLQHIANRTFNGLIELQTLYLNDNHLSRLNGYEFEPLAQLKALYLQSNRLDFINNQTFIYLRSLEILDLSNNRLTSMNLDLFLSIGHHNIRLRQLSIAHNWWSCQCSSIQTFRQILKQKFLVNGGVQISDRNQLRCYYNSTTVGPLILDGITTLSALQQPVFASFLPNSLQASSTQLNGNNRQQQLSEINQCSESILDPAIESTEFNPPVIQPAPATPNISPEFSQPTIGEGIYQPALGDQQQPGPSSGSPTIPNQQIYQPAILGNYPQPGVMVVGGENLLGNGIGNYVSSSSPNLGNSNSGMPLTSFLLVSVMFVCMLVIALSIFVFVRQKQRIRRHHHHHKKSSAASTTSVSSSASSTAISAAHHLHHHHQKLSAHQQQQQQYHTLHHHLIMADNISNRVSSGPNGAALTQGSASAHHHGNNNNNNNHHHNSASSQSSNIYAALVSPTTGSSTIVTSSATNNYHQNGTTTNGPIFASQQQQQQNNLHLYSNSSTTASSSSSQHQQQNQLNGQNYRTTAWQLQQQQQPFLNQHSQSQYYGQVNGLENPYAINATNLHAPVFKGGSLGVGAISSAGTGSLYNVGALPGVPPASNCHETLAGASGTAGSGLSSDWIKLPKVKQFMSKLVNKSLALGGYRLRDDYASTAANMSSDKIYDAFLSYDERDEPFVMQHLAAELEYGQPQFRIADRIRDLPSQSSAYKAEAISSVIGCSHRTILVLTENYLRSDWCRFELQAALRESSIDRQHKIIAIILDPKCLLELNGEMRSLLTTGGNSIYSAGQQQQQQQQHQQHQQQLVQLADSSNSSSSGLDSTSGEPAAMHQLIATLTRQSGGNQQVSAQLATSRITFINYNEHKFWHKLKQLMPVARPSAPVALTLTTKN